MEDEAASRIALNQEACHQEIASSNQKEEAMINSLTHRSNLKDRGPDRYLPEATAAVATVEEDLLVNLKREEVDVQQADQNHPSTDQSRQRRMRKKVL